MSAAYLVFGPRVYGKKSDGTRSFVSQFILFPYTTITYGLWNVTRLLRRGSAYNELINDVLIGRRLLSSELPENVETVVDLTCEFTEPAGLRKRNYLNFPILDASVPSAIVLAEWASIVASVTGCVFIHCAEGHGRTGMFAAALLYARGECNNVSDAIAMARKCRPAVRLQKVQTATLEKAIEIMKLASQDRGNALFHNGEND